MQQLVTRLREQVSSLSSRSCSTWYVRVIGGLLFAGWIGGALVAGVLPQPSQLNAATPEHTHSIQTVGQETKGFAEVAKNVRPAIVHITVTHEKMKMSPEDNLRSLPDFWGRKFFDRPFPMPPEEGPRGMGSGSGVLVSADGHVITNNHVVEGANRVTVTLLDKRQLDGEVIGTDPKTDLALVKVDGKGLPYLKWGDSSHLQVGDYVLAIGNPFGLTATVTQGIVSALGRGGMGITQYEDFIQTDAAINPGNSGGALVNASGELIGINTAIFSRTGGYQGIGFAVPSSMAESVYASLVKDGKVVRGYLGVGIQEMTPELAATFQLDNSDGALITDVKPGSPAALAGLKRGDTVVEFQKVEIDSPRGLQREVMKTPVGSAVSIIVIRDGQEQTFKAVITEQSNPVQVARSEVTNQNGHLSGLMVDELDPTTARRLGVDRLTEGVVVTGVHPGSSADRAGLAQGDIIREVNRTPIESLEDYERVATSLTQGKRALFFVVRGKASLFLSVMV